MKRLLTGLLGLALLVGGVAAANANDVAPPFEDLDIDRIVAVQISLAHGIGEGEILEEFTEVELASARLRNRATELMPFAEDWEALIGADNFSMVTYENDGSITIAHVLEQPALVDLPPGFDYRFEQAEKTLEELRNTPVDSSRLVYLSNPREGDHTATRGGLGIFVSCGDSDTYTYGSQELPEHRATGYDELSMLTKTATLKMVRDSGTFYGALTSGHGPAEQGSCSDSQYTTEFVENLPQAGMSSHKNDTLGRTDGEVHFWGGTNHNFLWGDIYTGSASNWPDNPSAGTVTVFPGATNYDEDSYWNRGKFGYWRSDNDWSTPSINEDAAFIRHNAGKRRNVHVAPWRYTYSGKPAGWQTHDKYAKADSGTIVNNDYVCYASSVTALGQSYFYGTIPGGVDCGVVLYGGGWVYWIESSQDQVAIQGESGSPVFRFASEGNIAGDPILVGMVQVAGIYYQNNQYEAGFSKIGDAITSLEWYSDVSDVKVCGNIANSWTAFCADVAGDDS